MPTAPFPRPRLGRLLGCSVLLLAAASAHAGARDEVKAAMDKFLSASSYHATMTHSGAHAMTNEIDFVAPDRYRMQTPMGTQYIVGDAMIMDINGTRMRVPMPKGTLSQYRDPAKLSENAATMEITALGADTLDGKPARKYRMVSSQSPDVASVMWVGGAGYPLRIEVQGRVQGQDFATTIRYSRYNDPGIRVDPPK